MEIEFSRQILEKKTPISNIMEVGPEEGDLFLADVQDRNDEAKNDFRNFANAPKKAFECRLEDFQLSEYSKRTRCITR